MKPVLLHIGYPKTATTWVQRNLFWQDGNGFFEVADHDELNTLFVRPHPFAFDTRETLSTLEGALTRAAAGGLVPVVSAEFLCGNPFYGGREGPEYCRRLAQVFPGARVLVTIRNQASIYQSTYKQFIRRGGTLGPRRFFDPNPDRGYVGFDPKFFEFDLLNDFLVETFGQENVLFLCFEEFVRDAPGFVRKIIDFSGASVPMEEMNLPFGRNTEPSAPDNALPTLRVLNNFRGGPLHPVEPGLTMKAADFCYRGVQWLAARQPKPKTSSLRKLCAELTDGRYRESNRRLAEATGLDLKSFGYQC
jgi:hypothetical protein